jgi:hypothetical protein
MFDVPLEKGGMFIDVISSDEFLNQTHCIFIEEPVQLARLLVIEHHLGTYRAGILEIGRTARSRSLACLEL